MSRWLPERVEPLREFSTPDEAEAAMRRLLEAGLNPQLRVSFRGRPNFVLIPKSERDRALALLEDRLEEEAEVAQYVLPDGVPLLGESPAAGGAPPPSEGRYVGPEPEELRDYEPPPSLSEVSDPNRCPSCGSDRVEPLAPTALYLGVAAFLAALMAGLRFGVLGGLGSGAIAYLFVAIFAPRFPRYRCDSCGEHWR